MVKRKMGKKSCFDINSFIMLSSSHLYRITQSNDPRAFHNLFEYLENQVIIKDKASIWQVIAAIADKAFKIFLESKTQMVSCLTNSLI